MNSKEHPLFQQFPLQNPVKISVGNVPTPYHVYDGYGLFIGGVGDLAAARQILKNEDMVPVATTEGKAVLGIWICDFIEASLNAHHEVQFSFFVSSREISPLRAHPFNALAAPFVNPEVKMLCHGLWNSTSRVVAYNRELLSLNALQCGSKIQRVGKKVEFMFQDTRTKDDILTGSVKTTASGAATFSFMGHLGFRKEMALLRQPWAGMEVVNPKGGPINRNAIAKAYVKNDVNNLRVFDATDELKITHPLYKTLNFVPHGMQYMSGYKFVYLQPE